MFSFINLYTLPQLTLALSLACIGASKLNEMCWPFTSIKITRTSWEFIIRTLWYSIGICIIQSLGPQICMITGLLLCTGVIIAGFRKEKIKNTAGYNLAKEHWGLFLFFTFMQNIAMPYANKNPSLLTDASLESTIFFIAHSTFLALLCIYQHFFNIKLPWKNHITRSWYYVLLLWILTCHGVEVLLLTAFILTWIGMFIARNKTPESMPVGCQLAKESVWVVSFFWLVRSFLFQPFVVPTGSLEPTIFPGDFVLVKQYAYGIRFPVLGWNMLNTGTPQRGDIAVFRFPPNPSTLYVKRVIGVPGDHITYNNDTLIINGIEVKKTLLHADATIDNPHAVDRYREDLPGQIHDIFVSNNDPHRFRHWEWHVPPGNYLMLGDNRQGSLDSRFWGYVPDAMLVGKVEYIIFSLDKSNLQHLKARADRTLRSVYASD